MCRVCEHKERIDIESALLAGQPMDKVAVRYKVKMEELAAHKENCSHYLNLGDLNGLEVSFVDDSGKKHSPLQGSLYANEDHALASTQQQLLTTFKKATRQISRAYDMMDSGEGVKAARQILTKSVLDHHVGLASEIRQVSKARAELDRQYNTAVTDSPLSGPQAIVGAIMGVE